MYSTTATSDDLQERLAEREELQEHLTRCRRRPRTSALAEFVDGHPTFAREFGAGVREDGVVVASEFDGAVSATGSPRPGTEWDFAVAWGYKKTLADVLCTLQEIPGALPDDDALGGSVLPDPRTENDA